MGLVTVMVSIVVFILTRFFLAADDDEASLRMRKSSIINYRN